VGRYEDGLPPASPVRKHDESEEGVEQEELTVEFKLKIPVHIYEEYRRIAEMEHKTLQFLILQSMELRTQVVNLLNPPGTTIVRRLPNKADQLIRFVL
jgi:hypothetical protein